MCALPKHHENMDLRRILVTQLIVHEELEGMNDYCLAAYYPCIDDSCPFLTKIQHTRLRCMLPYLHVSRYLQNPLP